MRYQYLLLLSLGFAGLASAADAPTEKASWRQHEVEFQYMGFTTFYTCDGIEDKVKLVLKRLGARDDVQVRAMGCDFGLRNISPHAWVRAQFSTLTPMGADFHGESVNAEWQPFELSPRRPDFMGEGECELMHWMRPLVTGNFALRNLEYRASCTPHQISLSDYTVRGQTLQLVKPQTELAR
jgi:hypothetical protein